MLKIKTVSEGKKNTVIFLRILWLPFICAAQNVVYIFFKQSVSLFFIFSLLKKMEPNNESNF